MQKILIISHEYPPQLGGAGQVAFYRAKQFHLRGHDVTVITNEENVTDNKFYKILGVKAIGQLWFLTYPFYLQRHNLTQYDLIILNDPIAIYSAGKTFSKEIFSKTKVYIHGVERHLFSKKIKPRLVNFSNFYLRALSECNEILTPSQYMKQRFFSQADTLKVLLKKVRVIPNEVDTNIFYYENDGVLDKYTKQGSTNILSVSRLVEKKGYVEKLKFFKELINKGYKLQWFIVGDGPFKKNMQDYILQNNLENSIHLIGQIDHSQLRSYYSACKFFWLFSNLEESFGLVYLEAMACRCIPIGRNHCAVKEVIKDGYNGFLTSHISDIEKILLQDIPDEFAQKLPNRAISNKDSYDAFF